MAQKIDIYGQVVLPAEQVPSRHVDRMSGFRVGRRDGAPAGLELHFVSEGQPQRLTIPILEAMFLLSVLKAFQLNEDLPFPEDPRDASWTASQYRPKSGQ